MCLTKFGLVNNDIRKKVWPLLLNLHTLEDAVKREAGGDGVIKNVIAVNEKLQSNTDWTSLAKKPHKEYE